MCFQNRHAQTVQCNRERRFVKNHGASTTLQNGICVQNAERPRPLRRSNSSWRFASVSGTASGSAADGASASAAAAAVVEASALGRRRFRRRRRRLRSTGSAGSAGSNGSGSSCCSCHRRVLRRRCCLRQEVRRRRERRRPRSATPHARERRSAHARCRTR